MRKGYFQSRLSSDARAISNGDANLVRNRDAHRFAARSPAAIGRALVSGDCIGPISARGAGGFRVRSKTGRGRPICSPPEILVVVAIALTMGSSFEHPDDAAD